MIGDARVSGEDRVVYLLASLPESYNMLVTTREASLETVPKMTTVIERLMHKERKMKEKLPEIKTRKLLQRSIVRREAIRGGR